MTSRPAALDAGVPPPVRAAARVLRPPPRFADATRRAAARSLSAAVWLAAAGGVLLRLRRALDDRSLWLDEAFLAYNVVTRDALSLVSRPLAWWQSAPPGFLLAERAAVVALGSSEAALRLVPFLAGAAAVVALAVVARRALPDAASAAAVVALFAILEPAVYFSTEIKPYAVDALAAIGVVGASLAARRAPSSPRIDAVYAAVCGAALVCSSPALFAVASSFAVVSFSRLGAGDRHGLRRLLVGALACAAIEAGEYAFILRRTAAEPVLQGYWGSAFAPDVLAFSWLGAKLLEFVRDFEGLFLPHPGVVALLAAWGAAELWRRSRALVALLVGPVALAFAASALRAYPFQGRLLHFSSPAWCVFVGVGACASLRAARGRALWVVGLAVLLACAPGMNEAWSRAHTPPVREELRDVVAHVKANALPGDLVYVFKESEVPFAYYRDRFGTEPARVGGLAGAEIVQGRALGAALADELRRLPARSRVWVLFSHALEHDELREDAFALQVLRMRGRELDRVERYGAVAALFDLRGGGS